MSYCKVLPQVWDNLRFKLDPLGNDLFQTCNVLCGEPLWG
jgi:hypothetical protein